MTYHALAGARNIAPADCPAPYWRETSSGECISTQNLGPCPYGWHESEDGTTCDADTPSGLICMTWSKIVYITAGGVLFGMAMMYAVDAAARGLDAFDRLPRAPKARRK